MMANIDTTTRGIGDNKPPEPTPFEASQQEIGDLYAEAKYWLDGEKVTTQAHADGIAKLMGLLRAATKTADERRKTENKPFDDGKTEVQARYNTLIGTSKAGTGQAVLAVAACKQALAPFLAKLEAEKQAAAAKARQEAEEKARDAREAIQAAPVDNLEQRAAAEQVVQEAKQAERVANRAERDTAKATSGVGRDATLRTTYKPVLVDSLAALKHYWPTHHTDICATLTRLAEEQVRAGVREIPGFEIHKIKNVV